MAICYSSNRKLIQEGCREGDLSIIFSLGKRRKWNFSFTVNTFTQREQNPHPSEEKKVGKSMCYKSMGLEFRDLGFRFLHIHLHRLWEQGQVHTLSELYFVICKLRKVLGTAQILIKCELELYFLPASPFSQVPK